MNPDRQQAWTETIIDHSQFPRRHGELDDATHGGHGENPFCGDRVHLHLRIDGDARIRDARFEAVGCAISTASASLLVQRVVGLSVAQAESLFERVHALLAGDPEAAGDELGELSALQMVRRYPARVKCATLAWHVLRHALRDDRRVATTE